MRKQRVSRIITSIIYKDGVTQMTTRGIMHTFVVFLQSKYEPIQVDDACLARMEKSGHRILPLGWKDFLDTVISEEELKAAVSKGACNKVPGRDDICLELLKVKWVSIMLALFKQMHLNCRIMKPKHDIVVYIHKTDIPTTPADSRPITLLNTDYKILAPNIENRLRPTLSDMLATPE